MTAAARRLIVVPHTHWDREWYRTHEEFRYRLVRLVDRVLDLLEGDPGFRHFTLDGQTIVVDDYLEVRPGARERIAKLVRDGRLLVGPWHVLPDEWLVSGEALIRNLRLGLAKAEALGGAMRIGYVPDQFGHVGQLPQLFAGFGFETAVLWRGVGADVDRSLFRWEAPDGTRLLTVYLSNGYGNAAQLPLAPEALAARLGEIEAELGRRSPIPELLLMNGSDHLEPQLGLPAALEAAAARLPADTAVEIGTLPGFAARAHAGAPAELPLHRGELRSGLRSPLLPGCASARAQQKRAEFANDRLLTRYLEPLAAWLGALGGDPDPGVIEHAWRVALENHPHDSVCGCSVDRVHDQMDTRFRRVEEIATTHLRRVAGDLAERVAVPERGFGRGAGEPLLVWNPNAAGVAVADAELELSLPLRDGRPAAFHLRDADGRRIPVSAEPVAGEREFFAMKLPKTYARVLLSGLGDQVAGHFVRSAQSRVQDGVLELAMSISEAPSGFDVRAARAALEAELARDDVSALAVRIVVPPRVRLRFADAFPGHGLSVYRLAPGRAGGAALRSGRAGGRSFIENEHWRVEVAADGRVRLSRRADGAVLEDALRLVSEGDRGDEYNFDPVPDDAPVERPERVRVRLERAGEARAALVIEGRWRVPAGLAPDRARRSARCVALPARLRVALHAGVDRVDVDVEVDNTAQDHRLRLLARAPFAARRFEVESAFEVALRPIAPAPDAFGSATPAERPIGAVPMRAFASVDDGVRALTLAARGAAEIEAVPEPGGTSSLAVSVLRAVGWLSRPDLVLRPGHAGPPYETPGAQVPGPHRLELSLRLHAAGDPARVAQAHAFAVPPLAFPGGGGAGAPLADGARALEVDDPEVVVSALEPRADGRPVLRIYNASPRPREVQVRLLLPGVGRLEAVDLAERPVAAAELRREGEAAWLRLRPWQIVTLRPS